LLVPCARLRRQGKALDRHATILREKMPISLPHRLGLVSYPFVDDPLVNAPSGQVAGEAMAIGMKANFEPVFLARQAPSRATHRLPEAAISQIEIERPRAADLTDDELAAGSLLSPGQQNLL